MNEENQNAKNEVLLENAIRFLRKAMLAGDQQAGEILQALRDLDEEFERTRAKVVDISSQPRRTQTEFENFYRVAIPALDRLIEIQKEKQCIAMQATSSNYKMVASLLKPIKQKKIVQNFLNN